MDKFINLFFANCTFGTTSKKSLPNSRSQRFFPTFFSRGYILLSFIFRCMIHFELIFVCGTKLYQRRQWHPTPVLLPGKSHGWRSLVGCSPCGCKESDTTERLHFHFSLPCIGEGNGNPLQCSCLENPRDRGAWWAAIYGVAQSWTRLTWLCSSSSRLGERGDLIERLGLTYKHYYIQIYN